MLSDPVEAMINRIERFGKIQKCQNHLKKFFRAYCWPTGPIGLPTVVSNVDGLMGNAVSKRFLNEHAYEAYIFPTLNRLAHSYTKYAYKRNRMIIHMRILLCAQTVTHTCRSMYQRGARDWLCVGECCATSILSARQNVLYRQTSGT